MIYDGRNGGTVEVLDNVLIIRRKGITGFLTQGLKGEKRIPFSSITSVQFKEPGITTGYIQFGIMGGMESRGGVFDATTDENTVLFLAKALKEFRQLRDIVDSRIGRPAQATPAPAASSVSFSEELTRLADLRDRGVLTEDEFAEEKARLQSQRNSKATPALSKPGTFTLPPRAAKAEAVGRMVETPKSTVGRKLGMGCLIIIGVLVGLMIVGAIVSPEKGGGSGGRSETATVEKKSADPSSQSRSVSQGAEIIKEDAGRENLTANQNNAVRSAEQYLSMSGFSRDGLIQQLSSDAGDGYSVVDATAAVDSLSVDWNENAVKSAKQYLGMSGFSCKGLIQQLSSSAGDRYTVDQPTYGARQAGVC